MTVVILRIITIEQSLALKKLKKSYTKIIGRSAASGGSRGGLGGSIEAPSSPRKWNHFVSMRANHLIFVGYLRK